MQYLHLHTIGLGIWWTSIRDEGAKATVKTPQMKDAIEFYRGMVEDGLVPAGSQTDSGSNFFAAFAGGNIGITPSGSFAIGALNNQYPDLDMV